MKDIKQAKFDFPLFTHEKDLVYLDSAATALKPQIVIDAEREYLERYSANIARGLYPLAEKATEKFEAVRGKIASFIGAASSQEIIFTAGATGALNLVAELLADRLQPGDNVATTEMEHHSNFLPWKELAKRRSLDFRVLPITPEGLLDIAVLKNFIDEHTQVVAFSAVSNVLGTINPVQEITALIKSIHPHIIVVVDAAQAVSHLPLAVSEWGADFVAFSAHKMFGPTGVGVLYGKQSLLETLHPIHFGGGMVLDACAKETLYKDSPYRFEAGTPNIGGVIALGAAIEYVESIGTNNIRAHEMALTAYALKRLKETFGETIRIVGPLDPAKRGGIIAFSFENIHPHDIAHLLGEQNICVRAGEHCATPLHRSLHLHATTRISFSLYNNENNIKRLIVVLKEIQTLFSK
ncbi:MAG: SufS family cysteine desulfurase [Candidatus Moraniibacteriota bacterium]